MPHLNKLPYDIYDRMLSTDEIGVLEIHALKQTSRALRKSITSLLENHPALYRRKLNILAQTIPTGLPKDLLRFTVPQLEAAALSSFVVERHWRAAQPKLCRAPRVYHADIECDGRDIPKVTALKVLPGGRWIIAGLEPSCISVWDTLTERLVAQCEDCVGVCWIELDITENGNILLAVAGVPDSEPVLEHALLVYSLTLDPPPTARDDTRLNLLGYAASPTQIENPTIKGSIACGTYYTEDEYCILVYDWQKDAGKILQIGSLTTDFEPAASLVILPGHILLYQRHRSSPVIAVFEIPELDPLPEEDEAQPPPRITTPPVYLQLLVESDPEFGQDDFLSSVVEDPSSSSSVLCLAALAIQADNPHQQTLDQHRIYFDLFSTATDFDFNTLSVPLREPFRRAVRVYPSTTTAGSMYEGESWRPLMAMGRTGKRAVWVETELEARRGGLIGFTAPSPPYADDPADTFANDLRDPAYERTEEAQQTRENFEGESPLRRLKSAAVYTFADATALGFDEATATVAVGDGWGRVWVLNYGPRSLEVW